MTDQTPTPSSAGDEPVCSRCQATSSLMWHRGEEGAVVCLGCHSAEKGSKSSTVSETSSQNGHSTNNHGSTLRRNTRLREKGGKAKQNKGGERQCAPTFKGGSSRSHQTKSRRTVLKQKPMRAAKSQPTIVTSDSMIHKVGII